MSDIVIKVENLSKRYRLGLKEQIHGTTNQGPQTTNNEPSPAFQ